MLADSERRMWRKAAGGLVVLAGCLAMEALSVPGCGGIREGTTYTIQTAGRLYRDPAAFRDEVGRARANVRPGFDEELSQMASGKVEYLDLGVTVKVVEAVPGGARVAVTSGKRSGDLGWMLEGDLAPQGRR